jgi:hypothetical protein
MVVPWVIVPNGLVGSCPSHFLHLQCFSCTRTHVQDDKEPHSLRDNLRSLVYIDAELGLSS